MIFKVKSVNNSAIPVLSSSKCKQGNQGIVKTCKQEVKRMENRFSDQDLLKLKEAAEAKWKLADQKDKANSLTRF